MSSIYSLLNNKNEIHFVPTRNYYIEWSDFDMKVHTHNAIEIMYAFKGEGCIETEGIPHRIKTGTLVFIDSNVPHKLTVAKDQKCRMLNVEFTIGEKTGNFPSITTLIEDFASLKSMLQNPRHIYIIKTNPNMYFYITGLITAIEQQKNAQLQMLFLQTLEEIALLSSLQSKKEWDGQSSYINQIENYIEHNYAFDIKIKDVAKHVGLQSEYMERLFKQKTGSTIINHLNCLRVEKAKKILLYEDILVSNVGDYVGISSRQYFYYIFKKYANISPSEFRKTYNKALEHL